mgnify:FL=1|jgi:hypothetical protein
MSDLLWQKVFNFEKQIEVMHEIQREQVKINKLLLERIKKIEDKS